MQSLDRFNNVFFDLFIRLMAVEPFDETLESWMADGMKKMNIELAKEILIQVTNGLAFFHLNQLIHGNLSIDQIVLDRSTGSFIAKISKLKFDGKC